MSIQVFARRALSLAALVAATPVGAANDILLTPPAGGGVSMTNAAGNMPRLRVGEDGNITMTGNFEMGSSTSAQGNLYRNGVVLLHNNGGFSTFVGQGAGNLVTTGFYNTAVGSGALAANTVADGNTAIGTDALHANTGGGNTAGGMGALISNTIGGGNTALGRQAMYLNLGGSSNTAVGYSAMSGNTTGNYNIAIGLSAGATWTTGSDNIAIGNMGDPGDAATTRVGYAQNKAFIAGIRGITTVLNNAIPVLIDSNGQLGTVSSSRAVKDDIADMEAASASLMKLRPVTFHYKSDSSRHLEYGLIAEEVAEVLPGLVAHSNNGRIETVMYQYLPPMLLNEYQKQQRRIDGQARHIEAQDAKIAQLQELVGQLISERKKP